MLTFGVFIIGFIFGAIVSYVVMRNECKHAKKVYDDGWSFLVRAQQLCKDADESLEKARKNNEETIKLIEKERNEILFN